jgi:hypothetical protein
LKFVGQGRLNDKNPFYPKKLFQNNKGEYFYGFA